MTSTARLSKDVLIRKLQHGMSDFTNFEETIGVLQLFEVDPLILEKALPSLINELLSTYFTTNTDNRLKIARLFYEYSKIFKNKRIRVQIPIKIYDLSKVLALLKSSQDWHSQYLLITWLAMLVISPFKFDNDTEILLIVSKFNHMALMRPLISNIKAELWSKNYALIELPEKISQVDPIDLSYMLKTLKHKTTYPFSIEQLIEFTQYITSLTSFDKEIDALYTLQLLPHFVTVLANRDETYSCIYDILFWMTSTINLSFTDLRFKLAKSVSKIVLFVSNIDEESSEMIITDCVNDTEALLKTNSNESMDTDRLHTFLLIQAEFCRSRLLTISHIRKFTQSILPVISKFQQKRMMSTQGHQIRDAANFFCWSAFRSYTNIELQSLKNMFLNLLFTANFDHSPLIRKSAMAALQECLGRQGNVLLDNVTVLRLAEMHFGQLSNALTLFELFNGRYESYIDEMVQWLVLYSVGQNYDYQFVEKATSLLSEMTSQINEKSLSNMVSKYINEISVKGLKYQDPDICARSVYLQCKIDTESLLKSSDVLAILHQQKIPKVWNDQISFQALAELGGICSLVLDGSLLSKQQVERIFLIARHAQMNHSNYDDISKLLNQLVSFISADSEPFDDSSTECSFWAIFYQLFRLQQPLICCAAPFLSQNQFISLFYDSVSKMSCEYKGKMIDSLSQAISRYSPDEHLQIFLQDVVLFLDDYTTTDKGDVGRLTRLSTVNLILKHSMLFRKLTCLPFIENSLLRLTGEPSTEIRLKCFEALCTLRHVSLENPPCNFNAIRLYNLHYRGNNEFWKGYFFSAGEIHSTDRLISSAIDDLLTYYQGLELADRLLQLNEFARIVPSAKEFEELKASKMRNNILGTIPREIIKSTITFLNCWCRMLESGITLEEDFNYSGFFARVYNLQLAARSVSVTSYAFRLLTLLVCHQILNVRKNSAQFANTFIKILLKQLAAAKQRTEFSSIQNVALESLTHIYICADRNKKIELIQENSTTPQQFSALKNTDLLI